MQSSAQRQSRYIVGLDGLRALAVIAVVLYHVAPGIVPGGFIGVDIFFVVSGFLITTLLLQERIERGKINVRRFWLRRARRLLPALFVTICATSSIALFVGGDVLVGLGRQIIGASTFSNNWVEVAAGSNYFDVSNAHLFTNFWSLAVEEQFYLLWPFVIMLFLAVPGLRKRPRAGMWLSGAVAILSAISMAVLFHGANATRVYYGTDTHIFGLMTGALVAFWGYAKGLHAPTIKLYRLVGRAGSVVFTQMGGIIAGGGLLTLMAILSDQSRFTYSGGLVLASALSAIVLVTTVRLPGILHRLCTWRPLEWIGVRSYGIYLWHWPLLVLLRYGLPVRTPSWLIGTLTCIIALAVAGISYRYLETPIRNEGLKAFLARGIRRQEILLDHAAVKWKLRPHPVALATTAIIGLTVFAVISAPTKTKAQLLIEAGQNAIQQKRAATAQTTATTPPANADNSPAAVQTQTPATAPVDVSGSNITLVGDSVALAAAPTLQQRFPGILVDAEVSRSMRQGGLETVDALNAAGNMRGIVVVALGTNGYYGAGNLDKLIGELGDRRIIFVTSHAARDWIAGNNDNLHQTAARYHNVYIAEWDAAISSHPEDLVDGIHPNAAGGAIYADCIATVLATLK